MDIQFFRSFFSQEETNISINPTNYDDSTPVVVAMLSSSQAGDVFGVSKVKGGSLLTPACLSSICVVLPVRR